MKAFKLDMTRVVVMTLNVGAILVGVASAIGAIWYPVLYWGWALIPLGIAYLANSFRQVNLGKMAVVTCGGNPVCEVDSGWQYVPPVLFSLEELPTQNFSFVFGDPSEEGEGLVYHTTAFRVTLSDLGSSDLTDKEKETFGELNENPLTSILTVDPTVVLVFKIKPGETAGFIKAVGSIGNALKQLRHLLEGFLQGVVEKKPAIYVRLNTEAMSSALQAHVVNLVNDSKNPWCVDVVACRISSWGFPRRINVAIADLSKSIATAAQAVNEKKAAIEKGTGAAKAKELDGLAEQVIAKAKAEVAATPGGQFQLALEAAVEMAQRLADGKNTTIVVPSEDMGLSAMVTKLLKLGQSLAANVEKDDKTKKEKEAK